jgi:hypothetical protein
VEQAIAGTVDHIKERTIGVLVFGRDPSYDANADPIVRVTAGQIRRRLNQYYSEAEHDGELRIELPTGSYIPRFSAAPLPVLLKGKVIGAPPVEEEEAPTVIHAETVAEPVADSPKLLPGTRLRNRRGLILVALLLGAIGCFAAVWLNLHTSRKPVDAASAFWMPVVSAPGPITFCVDMPTAEETPERVPQADANLGEDRNLDSGRPMVTDVLALMKISSALASSHRQYRLESPEDASFEMLREGPVLLVGDLRNKWILRSIKLLRFGFAGTDDRGRIIDRKNPGQTLWSVPYQIPYNRIVNDYGIVARYYDPSFGQPVVIAAGLGKGGTAAVAELITNPNLLAVLFKGAPGDPRKLNIEAVVGTEVIDGQSGTPRVLATASW